MRAVAEGIETRSQLTQDTDNRASLAAISGEIRIAESDLETRQTLLAGAAEQMTDAEIAGAVSAACTAAAEVVLA